MLPLLLAKFGKCNSLTVISNDPGFKLCTLNQAIDEVNCLEQPGVTFHGIFCKSN